MTVVHMGAAVKGGGEQDGVKEEMVGGRLGDGVQTHACLHTPLCVLMKKLLQIQMGLVKSWMDLMVHPKQGATQTWTTYNVIFCMHKGLL